MTNNNNNNINHNNEGLREILAATDFNAIAGEASVKIDIIRSEWSMEKGEIAPLPFVFREKCLVDMLKVLSSLVCCVRNYRLTAAYETYVETEEFATDVYNELVTLQHVLVCQLLELKEYIMRHGTADPFDMDLEYSRQQMIRIAKRLTRLFPYTCTEHRTALSLVVAILYANTMQQEDRRYGDLPKAFVLIHLTAFLLGNAIPSVSAGNNYFLFTVDIERNEVASVDPLWRLYYDFDTSIRTYFGKNGVYHIC